MVGKIVVKDVGEQNFFGMIQVRNKNDLVAAIELLQSQHWDILQIYKLKKKPVIQVWQKVTKEKVKLIKIVLPVNYIVMVLTKKISFTGDGEVFMRKMFLRLDYTEFKDGRVGIRINIHQTRRQKPPGVRRK